MRSADDGDHDVCGGDDVDDDPDDARRDGDDDGGDSLLREGNSPAVFSLPELFVSLSGFRLVEAAEKLLVHTPDVFRSIGDNTPKGSRRGATGARGGPHPRPEVGPRQGAPLPPGAPLRSPFRPRDLFFKIMTS